PTFVTEVHQRTYCAVTHLAWVLRCADDGDRLRVDRRLEPVVRCGRRRQHGRVDRPVELPCTSVDGDDRIGTDDDRVEVHVGDGFVEQQAVVAGDGEQCIHQIINTFGRMAFDDPADGRTPDQIGRRVLIDGRE